MNTQIGLERRLAFINSELQSVRRPLVSPKSSENEPKLAVTISRQSGCGAHVVAEKLAEYLEAWVPGVAGSWTVFDRNLVEKVMEDHNLPRRLARFMPEDRISGITDAIDELFGLHPPSWTLIQKTQDTILRLAERGNVILIGRAANVITSRIEHVFHVRLVGSTEKRVEHIREVLGVEKKAAMELIRREDRGRKRYLKKYFHKDLDDLLHYHLVINTDVVNYEKAARIIGEAVLDGRQRGRVEWVEQRSIGLERLRHSLKT